MTSFRSGLPLLALFSAATFAQTANITVNASSAGRVVDERLFGVNSTAWDSVLGTAQTESLLQTAGIRAIRLPGGSLSDEYHWRTNTNLDHATIAAPWTWAAGFNKSALLTSDLGANAIVTVNYGTGTPQEAAAWVAYANFSTTAGTDVPIGMDIPAPGTAALPTPGPFDWQTARAWANLRAAAPLTTDDGMNFLRLGRTAPFAFKYWEVGNENYGSWESDLQSPQWNPVTYATRAATYIQKMRSVDASIKVGVVVVTGNQYSNWTSMMLGQLNTLGVRPDFVIYHRYDGAPNQEDDAKLLQAATTWQSDADNLRAQVNTAFGSPNAANIEIVVTENNSVYSNPGKQSTSLVNGLYLADSIAHVMKTEIKGVMWWDLRNGPPATTNNAATLYGWRTYGDYGIISTQAAGGSSSSYETYPTYYAFELLKYFARGGDTVIAASSDNALLTAFAVHRADNSYGLMVLNKDPANAITGSFTLTGMNATSAYVYTYGKANDDAAKPGATGCADITGSSATIAGTTFSRAFPSYSMTVVSLNSTNYPPPPAVSPVFVAQPAAASLTAGASASFTAGAAGCPVATYKWQRAPSGSATFTDVADGGSYAGSGTATLTVSATTTAMSGDQFRAVASNGSVSTNSSAVTMTVAAAPSSGSSSGGGGGGGGSLDVVTLLGLSGLLVMMRRFRRLTT